MLCLCVLCEPPRGGDAVAWRQGDLGVDGLPRSADFPLAILGGIIADRAVTAALEAMGDLPPVLAISDPGLEVAVRLVLDPRERYRVGIAEAVEDVGELGVLGCAVGVDDIPKGRGL